MGGGGQCRFNDVSRSKVTQKLNKTISLDQESPDKIDESLDGKGKELYRVIAFCCVGCEVVSVQRLQLRLHWLE